MSGQDNTPETPAEYEHRMRVWESEGARNMRVREATVLAQMEGFRGTINFATLAIKSLILVNGAAAIALLTFVGHLWAGDPNGLAAPRLAHELKCSFILFGAGVGTGVLCAGLSYLAQAFFVERIPHNGRNWCGEIFRALAVLSAVASFGAFLWGGWDAIDVFGGAPPIPGP